MGNGSQASKGQLETSIANQASDQDHPELRHFDTLAVVDPGQEPSITPRLWSIRDNDGVFGMDGERQQHNANCPSEVRHFPLVPAPSGHLIMPCGDYAHLQQRSGLLKTTTTFHAVSPSSTDSAFLEPTAEVGEASARGGDSSGGCILGQLCGTRAPSACTPVVSSLSGLAPSHQ